MSDTPETDARDALKLLEKLDAALALISAIRETATAPMAPPGPWEEGGCGTNQVKP